ncbi:hypothetical protein [Streptomyces sp. NPDC018055]|uniref:hypothetical protein n=1 Tax=Streptomyces sp. NPDC018055 TaxID=3365038 RepID=UPI0037BBDB35
MAGMNDEAATLEKGPSLGGNGGDPFGEGSHRIFWPRDIVVGQLQDEIRQTLGSEVQIAVSIPTDSDGADHTVGEQHRLTIFVKPSGAGDRVAELLAAHRPDPYYGMSDDEVKRAQLEEKVRSGAELTMKDMQAALRMLMP